MLSKTSALSMLFLPFLAIGSAFAEGAAADIKDATDPFETVYNLAGGYPNLRDCFHNQSKRPISCTASAQPQIYPQMQDKQWIAGHMAASVVEKTPVNGCYDINFVRKTEIPGNNINGRCQDKNAPFRVMITYTTTCANGAPTCKRESGVSVKVQIFNDGLDQAFDFSDLNKKEIHISSTQTGDPIRVACASLVDDGFRWSETKQRCVRPIEILCNQMLGLQYKPDPSAPNDPEKGSCVAQNIDCLITFGAKQPNICGTSGSFCRGYRFMSQSAGGVKCLCYGTSAEVDQNGRTCNRSFSQSKTEDPSLPAGERRRTRWSGHSVMPPGF